MTAPQIKGWCPGALTPMLSGDGWLVRIRPPAGRLTPPQAAGIAAAALTHGNGTIDLSSRANLQLRGIRAGAYAALIADLTPLGLIDATPTEESARNILVTPFWHPADDTQPLAAALANALATAPPLPAKFGFAIDAGPSPVLTQAPADIRIERSPHGHLILRPDIHPFGHLTTRQTAVQDALTLAAWFLASGGSQQGRGRMAALIQSGTQLPAGFTEPASQPAATPTPGLTPQGWLTALAFGQISAETLQTIAALNRPLRLTPWRMLLIEGTAPLPAIEGLITSPDNPLLRVTACTGAPGCTQALGETRSLARALAPHIPATQHLHISGCAKGCAHPAASAITLTATPHGYGLIHNGPASMPTTTILTAERLLAVPDLLLKAPNAPSL